MASAIDLADDRFMRVTACALVALVGCSGVASDPVTEPDPPRRAGTPGLHETAPTEDTPSADALRARVAGCATPASGLFAANSGGTANVRICAFPDAFAWNADLDVDCDGRPSTQCNAQTDPWFQDDTAAHDSNGDPLDAAALPFVVIPGVSSRFDFRAKGLAMGTLVAVIYGNRVVYGPLGDVGPTSAIGEASYAMAEALDIDPDPATGGADSGVTYIAFAGPAAKLDTIEDMDEAEQLGMQLALALLATPD